MTPYAKCLQPTRLTELLLGVVHVFVVHVTVKEERREALEHYNKLLGLLNLGVPRVKKPELFGEEQLAAE